jgi:hypothetical protein
MTHSAPIRLSTVPPPPAPDKTSWLGQVHLVVHFRAGQHRVKKKYGCCGPPQEDRSASQRKAPVYTDPKRRDPFFDTVHKTVGQLYGTLLAYRR